MGERGHEVPDLGFRYQTLERVVDETLDVGPRYLLPELLGERVDRLRDVKLRDLVQLDGHRVDSCGLRVEKW